MSFIMLAFRTSSFLPVATALTTTALPSNRLPFYPTRYYSSTTASDASNDSKSSSSNPSMTAAAWPTCRNPTPYDVFALSPRAPYNKRRYFELVKLYHPDRHHVDETPIDVPTWLDRYRLVVLANEILSNPQKRKAYDTNGLGWVTNAHSGPISIHEAYRHADKHWRSEVGNGAWRNATWEDWEAWHEAQGQPASTRKQSPIYMSNGAFAALVVGLVCLGSMTHYTHMENQATALVASRAKENQRITRALAARERAAAEMSREERLLSFIETAGYEFDWENVDK